jgi:hypothetical protein
MASVVQASYESRGWLVSELSSRCSYNQSPVMFETASSASRSPIPCPIVFVP